MIMKERDVLFWIKGYLDGNDKIEINAAREILNKIDEVIKPKTTITSTHPMFGGTTLL